MDGSVQIVDQLGTNRGLSENDFNGSKRVARVAVEHCNERQVFAGGLKAFLSDCHGTGFRQPRQGFHSAMQEFANLSPRLASLVARQSLSCVGQQKLVAFFYRVTTVANLSQHRLSPTFDPVSLRRRRSSLTLHPPGS